MDVARGLVLDSDSLDVLTGVPSPPISDPFCAHLQTDPRDFRKLFLEYPDLFSSDEFSVSTPKNSVFHHCRDFPCLNTRYSLPAIAGISAKIAWCPF